MNRGLRNMSLALLLAACGGGAPRADVLDRDVPPVTGGSWYRPAVGVGWHWQLGGSIDTTRDVELYDVDLFETSAELIAQLQQSGRRVICYFSAGSSEDWRPDFAALDPAVLGKPLDGWPGERWLDIRTQSVVDVMGERLDLAEDKGCDGVEPDNVDGYSNDSGFDLSADDQLAYNRWLANSAHARGLAVPLKNDHDQIPQLIDYFDFALDEECHALDACETLAPFPAAGKAALNAEYANSLTEAVSRASSVCPSAASLHLSSLVLPLALDNSFRVSCGS